MFIYLWEILKLLIRFLYFSLPVGTALTILISVTTVAALLVLSLCFCLWKCFLRKEGEYPHCITPKMSHCHYLRVVSGIHMKNLMLMSTLLSF